MRGHDTQQTQLFSYISPEARVPKDHPLRSIRKLVDEALKEMYPQFEALYSWTGRPSIPPEKVLRALLLQAFYTIRSERQLMEQLDYNLLFRWFVGLSSDEAVWDPTVFTKNRDRLLDGDIAAAFFEQVLKQARQHGLLSSDHFTVDGTLIEAWASQKSFKKKSDSGAPPPDDPGNPTVDFHGEKRCNDTHQSTTDPEARLYKKSSGSEAKLSYVGHVLMENANGLAVDVCITQATGTAERDAAFDMVDQVPGNHTITLGGDKNYDTKDFVAKLRAIKVTPHVAQNDSNRRSAIDDRTTRHSGYEVSQKKRKCVEEIFGWVKTIAGFRKTRYRGVDRVDWMFTLAIAGYNLVRMRNLIEATA
jgi:transposase